MARILVADDDDDFRRVAVRMLTAAGHEVVEAVAGSQTNQANHNQPAALVLNDV